MATAHESCQCQKCFICHSSAFPLRPCKAKIIFFNGIVARPKGIIAMNDINMLNCPTDKKCPLILFRKPRLVSNTVLLGQVGGVQLGKLGQCVEVVAPRSSSQSSSSPSQKDLINWLIFKSLFFQHQRVRLFNTYTFKASDFPISSFQRWMQILKFSFDVFAFSTIKPICLQVLNGLYSKVVVMSEAHLKRWFCSNYAGRKQFCAERLWARAISCFELCIELAGRTEAAFHSDCRNGRVAFQQHATRFQQPHSNDELLQGKLHGVCEQRQGIVGVKPSDACHVFILQWLL
jgi:hypothetical protein